jgi:hypothetical protein
MTEPSGERGKQGDITVKIRFEESYFGGMGDGKRWRRSMQGTMDGSNAQNLTLQEKNKRLAPFLKVESSPFQCCALQGI